MPLNSLQKRDLLNAIESYDYPANMYDFSRNKQVRFRTMRELENELRRSLLSNNPANVKYALANIVYWGNINSGYVMHRVRTFLADITEEEIHKAIDLFSNPTEVSIKTIKTLRLPQFSNLSFVSKLRMFLDPSNFVTLDRKLLKIKECRKKTLFHEIKEQPTYIPITNHNCELYAKWCKKCRYTADRYFFDRGVIAVDVERGIFHLVNNNKEKEAAELVIAMP